MLSSPRSLPISSVGVLMSAVMGVILITKSLNCVSYFLLMFHFLFKLKDKLGLGKRLNIHQEFVQTGQVESDVFKY